MHTTRNTDRHGYMDIGISKERKDRTGVPGYTDVTTTCYCCLVCLSSHRVRWHHIPSHSTPLCHCQYFTVLCSMRMEGQVLGFPSLWIHESDLRDGGTNMLCLDQCGDGLLATILQCAVMHIAVVVTG